jgi:hypothetical protein
MRRTLLSELPPSDAPSEPPASGVQEGSNDFGRWLTHDLRAKGSPSQVPIVERPSQLPSVVIPVAEQAELANWLLQDLRPRDLRQRSSAPPDAGVQRASLLPLSSASSLESLLADEALPPNSVLSPDSLVPHAVSEAPLSLLAPLEPALEDDDLAVLPSRRGKTGERSRRRGLVLLAALLGVAGLALWLRSGGRAEATSGVESAANAPVAAAPLPPPPPLLEETEPEAVLLATPATGHRSGKAVEPVLDDEADPGFRGRRAGDAVARFADLPLTTQSKLAREERQKARAHDASARARKASSAKP